MPAPLAFQSALASSLVVGVVSVSSACLRSAPASSLVVGVDFVGSACLSKCSSLVTVPKPQKVVPCCQKVVSVCKSRIPHLKIELKSPSESTTSSSTLGVNKSSTTGKSVADIKAKIETLAGLSEMLEKKLISNPKLILSEVLGIVSAKAKAGDKASLAIMSSSQMAITSSGGDFDSPTILTSYTNGAAGVTHLGVMGRGVKRVLMTSKSTESSPSKKPVVDPSAEKGDGNNC